MSGYAETVDLGFSVADAEEVSIRFDDGCLLLSFTDWREQRIAVTFSNTIGFRYQLAEYTIDEGERFDRVHRIHGSSWLRDHRVQNTPLVPDT